MVFLPSTDAIVNPVRLKLKIPLYCFRMQNDVGPLVFCEVDLASCRIEVTWLDETKKWTHLHACAYIWAIEVAWFSAVGVIIFFLRVLC